jgi:hypothetical protein
MTSLLFAHLIPVGTPAPAQVTSCVLAIQKDDVEALGDNTCDLKIDLHHSSFHYQAKL